MAEYPSITADSILAERDEILKRWYEDYNALHSIPLWENGAPGTREGDDQPQPSIAILPVKSSQPRGLVIVCAGGGFVYKCDYEGRVVAERMNELGFNSAVLDYRVLPYTQYDMIEDVKRAIRLVRFRAKDWNVNPERIAVLGFSGGGQLAALSAVKFDYGIPESPDPIERMSSRPSGAVVCYSGFSFTKFPPSTIGDLNKIFAITSREDRLALSVDPNLRQDSPSFFIWSTVDDQAVNARYPLSLVDALTSWEIPYELHLFPHGPHGMALCDETCPNTEPDKHVGNWVHLCREWLEDLGF
jgi:acetyl esterase/lipase